MKNVIGENIKRLRKQQEIKQAVLAAKLNIGRQTLSAYERGVTLPDVLALIEIADYFGVSLDELTGRSELIIPDEKE
ncbi:MAG TPA: helix-turn-helix domain-containing protein [Candidatus Mediterraneibacter tabaqchaliae]|uniref:Helix-turn-helix domain-containing protein n=1 Tax=Candidatus Mediterraneibacter tabaqchaliae TaxID=2838689 RepID=A0A9D2R3W5_9FIRM|nr:helix-turn-helix domain-containing protein [Candidatus Mediterraneibacter tabaqchaliae]